MLIFTYAEDIREDHRKTLEAKLSEKLGQDCTVIPCCNGALHVPAASKQNTPTQDEYERLLLIQPMRDFAIRVLSGKNCNPQETAILPEVLSLLLKSGAQSGISRSQLYHALVKIGEL